MKVTPLELAGALHIEIDLHHDSRGFFTERFNEKRFRDLGLPSHFVQDNFSRSTPGVLRGLHFQFDPPQGKLVGATRGTILDTIVDLRHKSPTYGRSLQVTLSGEKLDLLWVPAGFAHGFCVIGNETADVLYKTDAPFGPTGEGGVRWDDPDLAIQWPSASPLVAPRDQKLPSWKDYLREPRF